MVDVVGEDWARYRKTYDSPLSALLTRIWKMSLHMGLFETPDEPLTAAHERTKLQLARAADLSPGRHLFEAACGTGETARFFVHHFAITAVATKAGSSIEVTIMHIGRRPGLAWQSQ